MHKINITNLENEAALNMNFQEVGKIKVVKSDLC